MNPSERASFNFGRLICCWPPPMPCGTSSWRPSRRAGRSSRCRRTRDPLASVHGRLMPPAGSSPRRQPQSATSLPLLAAECSAVSIGQYLLGLMTECCQGGQNHASFLVPPTLQVSVHWERVAPPTTSVRQISPVAAAAPPRARLGQVNPNASRAFFAVPPHPEPRPVTHHSDSGRS